MEPSSDEAGQGLQPTASEEPTPKRTSRQASTPAGSSSRDAFSTPSASSKMRERLERLKVQRAESSDSVNGAGAGAGTGAGRGAATNGPVTPSSNADRRKMLQRLRQQSRAGGEDGELGSSTASFRRSGTGLRGSSSGKGAFRSSRSMSRLRGSRARLLSDGDLEEGVSEYDDDGEGSGEEQEDIEEDFEPLVDVEPPEYVYPLSFLPKNRTKENELQKVVLLPARYKVIDQISETIGDDCLCGLYSDATSAPTTDKRTNQIDFNENEFLDQEGSYRMHAWLEQERIGAPELIRVKQLIAAEQQRKVILVAKASVHAHSSGSDGTAGDLSEALPVSVSAPVQVLDRVILSPRAAASAASTLRNGGAPWTDLQLSSAGDLDLDLELGLLDRDTPVEDGIFSGKAPVLARVQLDGEQVAPAIAHFSAAHLDLSRATQRLLREMKVSLLNEHVRRKWREMMHHDQNHSGSGGSGGDGLMGTSNGKGVSHSHSRSQGVHFALPSIGDDDAEEEDEQEQHEAGAGSRRRRRRSDSDQQHDDSGGGEGEGTEHDDGHDGHSRNDREGDEDRDQEGDGEGDTTDREGREGRRRRTIAPKKGAMLNAQKITEVPPEARLLRHLDHSPMLQVIQNPVISCATQPSIPPTVLSYGGQLGQWGADHNPVERLGALPLGWSGRKGGQRSIFRLHLHQVVFNDHPLLSQEERRLVHLKETYAQYRSLFEQKVLEYLTQRLMALTTQLINLVEVPRNDYNEDELFSLRGIYRDVIETLPALNELNYAVDNLTTNIYEGWRELLEIRRRQSCTNTTADLSVRRVKSSLLGDDSPDNSRDEADDAEGGDQTGEKSKKITWDMLQSNLRKVPALMKQAQVVLFPDDQDDGDDNHSETASNNGSVRSKFSRGNSLAVGSEYEGHQSSLHRGEGAILKQAGLDKVVKGVSMAVQELVDSRGVIPQFALRLSEEGLLTPENQLPPAELKRRAFLKNVRLKAVLRINGRTVTTTDYYSFRNSTLSVDFNKYFEFRVLHQPSDVALTFYTNNGESSWGSLSDHHLATVAIAIPGRMSGGAGAGGRGGGVTGASAGALTGGSGGGTGGGGGGGGGAAAMATIAHHQHMAHSYVPTVGWYSFSSALPVSSWFSGFFAQPLDATAMYRRTEGSVLCTAEYDVSTQDSSARRSQYDGVRSDDLAMVPVPPVGAQSVTVHRAAHHAHGGINDFTKENDFQALLPEYDDLDLNDPRNDYLLYLKSKRSASGDRLLFRLTGADYATPFHGDDGRSFANYVHFKECARFKLLRLRNLKPYLFQEPIPLSELEIKNNETFKNIFIKELHESPMTLYGGTIAEEAEIETTNKLAGKESVNVAKVTSFLQRVRNSQTALTRKRKKKALVTSSVVVETDYFEMGPGSELPEFLARKRELHPRPKVRTAMSMQVDRCDLLVQIVGAKNIPLRSEFDDVGGLSMKKSGSKGALVATSSSRGNLGASASGERINDAVTGAADAANAVEQPIVSEHMLDEVKMKERRRARTFVEVRFQEHTQATTVFDGSTPMWKQSLSLPFRAPQNDFTPASLEQVREDVYFTLFDEVIEDDSNRGGLLEGENPIRVEKRYLGSFSVPFDTVFREGRIEGVFRLDTPPLNFGYDHNPSRAVRQQQVAEGMFVGAVEGAGAGAGAGAADATGTITGRPTTSWWFQFLDLLDWLSNMGSELLAPKSAAAGLDYASENIHPESQSEFSYFAADETATYMKVLVTLDPLLVGPPNIPEEITVSNVVREDRTIASYARGWLSAVKEIGPHTEQRNYLLFGTNSNGQNVLICRYLTPLRPPMGFETRRGCVHLVAMIPFMKDAQSFLGEMDLWCTGYQFWEIGAGDEEEHAVMLYNYLYYLEQQEANKNVVGATVSGTIPTGYPSNEAVAKETVFLATGRAVPEGDTVYVILRDSRRQAAARGSAEDYLIINPCTGYIYSAMDPNCPLRDIHTLATPYNMWANIQEALPPSELNYDVLNSALWRPLFGVRLPPPSGGLSSIQTPIEYVDSSPGYAVEVEKSIFQAIRNNMRRWRSKRQRSTTTFHPDACSVMHELLPKLENWKRCGNPDLFMDAKPHKQKQQQLNFDAGAVLPLLQGEVKERMRSLLRTRTLKGFPVNMAFTDVDEVVSKVKTWCIHEAKHPEVQFVMAVRAFPLYNNILSLWIFLGTLETNPL